MNKDITLTIEEHGIFLQVTYQCTIYRRKNSDDRRSWWEPDVRSTLIRADFTNRKDEEFEWFYGDPKPAPIERALELYDDQLEKMFSDKVHDIISNPNFENEPYAD
jgi:hypothetical protein